jgi:peptidoglycan/xylan/chitin deacetylase (PgdA/CDA1 family)
MRPRDAVAGAIRWSGLAWLVRQAWARRRVSILLYHDPSPETLERQLEFLARRYSIVPLDRVVEALRSGTWRELPPRPLVLTIDDGLAGNHRLREVFRRYDARPTIFLCSQIVGTNRHYWWIEGLHGDEAETLKALPQEERLRRLEASLGYLPARDYGPEGRQALTHEEVAEMADVCDLQSHGRFHPILTRCTDEEARREIAGSRPEVEALTGMPCRHFAYPNGSYSDREAAIAREAGYLSARTVDIGWNGRRADPYRLRILSVADAATPTMLAADLTGLKWLSRLVRGEGRLDGRFRPHWERG